MDYLTWMTFLFIVVFLRELRSLLFSVRYCVLLLSSCQDCHVFYIHTSFTNKGLKSLFNFNLKLLWVYQVLSSKAQILFLLTLWERCGLTVNILMLANHICVFAYFWEQVKKEEEIERCVIGNNTIYQAKSICHCEKGGEEEEKWHCLVRENVLFSNNGIRGAQSISLGPVGNVFVFSNWQGTKSIMTYCWTCLYSVSRACPQSTSAIRKDKHTHTHSNTVPKRALTDVW